MQYKTLQEILQANTQWYCYDGEPTPADFTQMCNEVNNEVRNYVDCLLDRLETWQSIVMEDVKELCKDTHPLRTKYRESYILCVENLLIRLRAEIERHSKVLDLQTLDNAILYRMGVFYSWDDVEFSTREDAEVKCDQLRKEKKSFVAFPDYFKNVWVVIENKADGQLQGSINEDAAGGTNEPIARNKKGRPVTEFKDLLIEDEDGKKYNAIETLMKDAKQPKKVALIMYVSEKMLQWLSDKPSHTTITYEFGDIGCGQNMYNQHYSNFEKKEYKKGKAEIKEKLLQLYKPLKSASQ